MAAMASGPSGEPVAVDELALQARPERLGGAVVEARGHPPCALDGHELPTAAEHLDGDRVERQLPSGVGLGVPDVLLPVGHGQALPDPHPTRGQVHVGPLERYQFTPRGTGQRGQGDRLRHKRVIPLGRADQIGQLLRSRGLRLPPDDPRGRGLGGRGPVDVVPLHRLTAGGRQDAVVLVHRRLGEPPIEPVPVGLVEPGGVKLLQLEVAEEGADAVVDLPPILLECPGLLLRPAQLEPLVEELADGDASLAHVSLTDRDSTSCTKVPSALAAARSEPTKVFVLRICFPVTES